MTSDPDGGGGRWRICHAIPAFLLWMALHRHVLGCELSNCNLVLTLAQGEFMSPCYPEIYPTSHSCKWIIVAPAGFIIQLSFLDFELEEAMGCMYDHVLVNTGSSTTKFCGLTPKGMTLNSTGNILEVSFHSDFSIQKRGFHASFRHVAVALRNQKVTVLSNGGRFTKVSSSVSMPTLSQLTVCFELERAGNKQKEWIFTYFDRSRNTALSLGSDQSGMKLIIDEVVCSVESIFTAANFTSSMTPFCMTWNSKSGNITVYFNGGSWTATCSASSGHLVPGGGLFRLGGQHSFNGYIYNFRLWDSAMTPLQLSMLACDTAGNVIDWDNSYWDIPSSQAQTNARLSCSVSLSSTTTATTSCHSPSLGCRPTTTPSVNATNATSPAPTNATAAANATHAQQATNDTTATANHTATNPTAQHESFFYRLSVDLDAGGSAEDQDVRQAVTRWLNQTFQNWTHNVYVDHVSIETSQSDSATTRYTCQALLVYSYTTNQTLSETAVSARLTNSNAALQGDLQLSSVHVGAIENCPEENPLHYRWPESRPSVTQHLPCFPNKESSTSRTCLVSPLNYSSYWSTPDISNCTDIASIEVSPENAAEVAEQLADITSNELSDEEVSKVVRKVQELVSVAKINASLASTVVTIFSNVMSTSDGGMVASSDRALQTVDQLAQKLEFDGPSVSVTSRHLALGISALNSSTFSGTSFSAFTSPNTSDPQVDFTLETSDPLAQVTLPDSLLFNATLTEAERSSLSRISFMFFSKTNLFQSEQDGRSLNSYVVSSSVGNVSIRNLQDPVRIEISHIFSQPSLSPVCMFWDFSMNNGAGGWNRTGCEVAENSTSNKTVCLCDHLTHFGILMDVSGAAFHINEENTRVLTFITYIGCGVSAIFSAATLLTYIAFEKLRRDYPSKILMNLSTSLLFLNMVFLLDGWLTSLDIDWLCSAVAILLHYFLLTSFTWMGLESVHMYIALVKVFNTYIRRYILKFCIVGWGLPAVVVVIVASVDAKDPNGFYGRKEYGGGDDGHGASEFCWINDLVVFYVTCVGYFCLVFLLNVAMFIVVMLQICGRNGKRSNRTLREEVLRNLRSVVSLTFLLGMTWGFALFAWGPVNLPFMYLFTIFNSLQGLFIFIFHCALKENVQKQWRRSLCCGRLRLSDHSDWSKTATNTKKVSSDNLAKSLSSSSLGSSATSWTSRAKVTLHPFTKRHSNTDKLYSNQTVPACISSSSSSSEVDPSSSPPILPVSQVIDKVRGYCSTRSDNFYKNIMISDRFNRSARF